MEEILKGLGYRADSVKAEDAADNAPSVSPETPVAEAQQQLQAKRQISQP